MSDSDLQAIHSIRAGAEAAENCGDADYFLKHCSDDVVVMPPAMPQVTGAGNVAEFMREFFRQFDFRISYSSEETQVFGDRAFDRGSFTHTLTPQSGGDSIKEDGKYFWFYSRTRDGQWKMSRVIWNMN